MSTRRRRRGGAGVGSLGALRERNQLRVVDELRRRGTASRAELARLTGLSRTTVTTVVAELQARGLVIEREGGPDGGGRGRPPAMLALDTTAGAAVGVDFGHRHVRVAVADLGSNVLAERAAPLDVDHAAGASLDAAAELVCVVLADAGLDHCRVVGVGMGLPGPIDARTGAVGSTAILEDWVGLRVGAELARRLDLHVEVDNDANLGALGELTFGRGRGRRDVAYVKVSSGVGSGLVLGGRLQRGATGMAGELGHVQVRPDGRLCRCGNRGCLETIASAEALLALLRPAHGASLDVGGLLALVAAGDPGARRVVADAGLEIGRVLADLCNLLNPELIIVGGDLSAAGGALLEGIRAAVDRYAQPCIGEAVEVVAGVLGERAEVLGAIALVAGDTERLRSAELPALGVGDEPLVAAGRAAAR